MFHKLNKAEKAAVLSYLLANSGDSSLSQLAINDDESIYDRVNGVRAKKSSSTFNSDIAYFLDNRDRDPDAWGLFSSPQQAKQRQLTILQKIELGSIHPFVGEDTKDVLKRCELIKRVALLPAASSKDSSDTSVLQYYWQQGSYHQLFIDNAFQNVNNSQVLSKRLKVAKAAERLAEQLLPQRSMWGWLTGQNNKRRDFISNCLSGSRTSKATDSAEEVLLSAFVQAMDDTDSGQAIQQYQGRFSALQVKQLLDALGDLKKDGVALNQQQRNLASDLNDKIDSGKVDFPFFSWFRPHKKEAFSSIAQKLLTNQEPLPHNSSLPSSLPSSTQVFQAEVPSPVQTQQKEEPQAQLKRQLSQLLTMQFVAAATIGSKEVDSALTIEAEVGSLATRLLDIVPVAGGLLAEGAALAIKEYDLWNSAENAKKLVKVMGAGDTTGKIEYFSENLAVILADQITDFTEEDVAKLADKLVTQLKNSLINDTSDKVADLAPKTWLSLATNDLKDVHVDDQRLQKLADFVPSSEKITAVEDRQTRTEAEILNTKKNINLCFTKIYDLANQFYQAEQRQNWVEVRQRWAEVRQTSLENNQTKLELKQDWSDARQEWLERKQSWLEENQKRFENFTKSHLDELAGNVKELARRSDVTDARVTQIEDQKTINDQFKKPLEQLAEKIKKLVEQAKEAKAKSKIEELRESYGTLVKGLNINVDSIGNALSAYQVPVAEDFQAQHEKNFKNFNEAFTTATKELADLDAESAEKNEQLEKFREALKNKRVKLEELLKEIKSEKKLLTLDTTKTAYKGFLCSLGEMHKRIREKEKLCQQQPITNEQLSDVESAIKNLQTAHFKLLEKHRETKESNKVAVASKQKIENPRRKLESILDTFPAQSAGSVFSEQRTTLEKNQSKLADLLATVEKLELIEDKAIEEITQSLNQVESTITAKFDELKLSLHKKIEEANNISNALKTKKDELQTAAPSIAKFYGELFDELKKLKKEIKKHSLLTSTAPHQAKDFSDFSKTITDFQQSIEDINKKIVVVDSIKQAYQEKYLPLHKKFAEAGEQFKTIRLQEASSTVGLFNKFESQKQLLETTLSYLTGDEAGLTKFTKALATFQEKSNDDYFKQIEDLSKLVPAFYRNQDKISRGEWKSASVHSTDINSSLGFATGPWAFLGSLPAMSENLPTSPITFSSLGEMLDHFIKQNQRITVDITYQPNCRNESPVFDTNQLLGLSSPVVVPVKHSIFSPISSSEQGNHHEKTSEEMKFSMFSQ